MFQVSLNYTILEFCKDVLKKRFPGSPIKQEINDSDPDKINFACPYCGDSTKNPNKKRGNLYLTTNTYKCYNDGCSVRVPFEKFVSHFVLKYSLSIPTIEKKKIEFNLSTSKKKKGFLLEFLINQEVGSKLLRFSEIVDRFFLIPCAKAPQGSPVFEFIQRRGINLLPVFEKTCYYDSREDKIYLFNLDLRSDKVIGFAIRHIDDSWQGPKYNIKNYAELIKNGLVSAMDTELLFKINTLNNYFNILNVNFTQDLTIVEGQIDSMFVENCIALTGVTKGLSTLENLVAKEKTRILFDNDKAGKGATLDLIKKGYRVFLWVSATAELKKRYPEHSRSIPKIKDVNDLYLFMSEQDPELDFGTFNKFIDRHFSNSAFDLILI